MEARVSRRHRLSKRSQRELVDRIRREYGGLPKVHLELVEEAHLKGPVRAVIYLLNGDPCFALYGGRLIPLLPCMLKHGHSFLPSVIVDRGAALAVARGADLMAPGVRTIDGEFEEGSLVAVVDEVSSKPVMVGEALKPSREMREILGRRGRGRVVRNLHHIGDKLYEACRQL